MSSPCDTCVSLFKNISGSCGGLNENGLQKNIYVDALSIVSGTLWDGLGGVGFLEKVWSCW